MFFETNIFKVFVKNKLTFVGNGLDHFSFYLKITAINLSIFFLANNYCYAQFFDPFKSENIKKSVSTNQNQIIFKKNVNSEDISNNYLPESSEVLNSYILGVGDIIQVDMLSRDIDFEYTLQINLEGKIFIPKVGEFNVVGLTTNKLKEKIDLKVAKKIKEFDLSVFLVKPKNIKVFLTGYANKPGSYTIGYGSRLFDFLKYNEGVNENGSVRNIEITSSKGIKKTFDLNNFIYKGDLESNPIIKSGDKIYVPYITKRIAIVGEISKAGVYEIKDGDNLKDTLRLAGALSNGLDTNNIKVWKNGMNKVYDNQFEYNLVDLKINSNIEDSDILYIPSIRQPQEESIIHVYGQVAKVGSIPFKRGYKFSDYFKLAGGATSVADIENIKMTRTKNINGKIVTENYIINANDIIYNGKSEKDIFIEPNDVIFIPEKFFNFRNFTDITGVVLSALGIVSLVLSFTR